MRRPERQKGVVLVVSLLMIAVLALLATASINLSGGSMLVIGNQQAQQDAAAAAETEVEATISDLDNFTDEVAWAGQRDGIAIARSAPVCIGDAPMPGFSLTNPLALQHNYYQFRVTANDADSGAGTAVNIGVRALYLADTCH
jgi:hypothetical protein